MRLDMYTSSDRAAELKRQWLEQEAGRYWTWAFVGAILTAVFIVFCSSLFLNPDYLFSEKGFTSGGVFYPFDSPVILTLKNSDSTLIERFYASLQSAGIGPIWFFKGSKKLGLIWIMSFGISIFLCRFYVQLIAISQGLVYGFVSFDLSFIVLHIIISTLDIQIQSLDIIGGGIVGFLVFIYGSLGGFLPAAR